MNLRLRICSLLFVAAFTSCTPNTGEISSQNSQKEYEIVTKQEIALANFFTQKEADYLVFIHSDTCPHCKEILGDVAAFAEENIKKTYFLNVSKDDNKINKVPVENIGVGVDNLDDLVYAGTPTLFEIENGVTTANIPGKDACLTFLNEIRKNNM